MSLAVQSCVLQWYWTYDKRTGLPQLYLFKTMGHVVAFHSGTLAFGSLILAIVKMVRVILEYIERKIKYFNNDFARFLNFPMKDFTPVLNHRFLLCCFKCCLWCLDRFLRFISHSAYIMCAVKVRCWIPFNIWKVFCFRVLTSARLPRLATTS